MPLFSKKQPVQPQSRRNPAAVHNARLRAKTGTQTPVQRPSPAGAPAESPESATPPIQQTASGPGQRLRALTQSDRNVPPPPLPTVEPQEPVLVQDTQKRSTRKLRLLDMRKVLKAAVKFYQVVSVVINLVLLLLVLILAISLKHVTETLNNVLSGLYENFVVMDNAVISTTIHLEDVPIPLDFTLPVVQEETYVTLTRPATIRNATVGVLSLPTTVTLPAGTTLAVSLAMDVPVKTTLAVDLDVPVNIKLAQVNPPAGQASLHEAFLGLQNTVGPFYCLFKHPADSPAAFVCEGNTYRPQSAP